MTVNETDFLTNIALRLGRPSPLQAPPERSVVGAPDFWKDYQLSSARRVAQFQTALENLGGHVVVCGSLNEIRTGLSVVLSQLNGAKVGTWGGDTLADFDTLDVLMPYHPISWNQESQKEFEQVDVGITGCAWAVADTGTLVMKSDANRGRSVSVLPTVHIALIRENQIYTRLGEVMDELTKERDHMASSVHFISGPSRSSDIENDQTIGIHGPAAVYVFILKS